MIDIEALKMQIADYCTVKFQDAAAAFVQLFSDPAVTAVSAFFMAYCALVISLSLIETIIVTLARWRMFLKAGIHGWKSLIPVLNHIYDYKAAWGAEWGVIYYLVWIFIIILAAIAFSLNLLPALYVSAALLVFNGIVDLIYRFKLSKSFGHGFGWGLGLVLFYRLFFLMIGLGKSRYTRKKN